MKSKIEKTPSKKIRKKKTTSSDLLNDKFRYLVSTVLASVKADTVPYLYNKTEIYLGEHYIRKDRDSFVIYKQKQVVPETESYFLLESAMLVSYSIQHDHETLLHKIKELDSKFTKYYFDCLHLYTTITALRKGNADDISRANAIIVKYEYAKEKRSHVKKLIRQLCLRNIKK